MPRPPLYHFHPLPPLLPLLAMLAVVAVAFSGCATPPQLEVPVLTEVPMTLAIPQPDAASTNGAAASALPAAPTLPKALATPVSTYPEKLREAGLAGRIVVAFTVGVDGRAHDFEVVSSTDARITRFFLETVEGWRYEPAQENGQPVPMRIRVPVRLELTDSTDR